MIRSVSGLSAMASETHVHLALAMADGQGRALSRGDDQILLAVEEESQREGAFKVFQRLGCGLSRGHAAVEKGFAQMRDRLGVRVAFELAVRQRFLQRPVVLDDTVMDDDHAAGPVRVGVPDRGAAMGRPAGVPDPGLSGERLVDQQVREIVQLADRAAAVQRAVMDRCNARAVIAAIFQPLECLDEDRGCLVDPSERRQFRTWT